MSSSNNPDEIHDSFLAWFDAPYKQPPSLVEIAEHYSEPATARCQKTWSAEEIEINVPKFEQKWRNE